MSAIATVFAKAEHAALIPFVTVGYPTIEATLEAVPALEAAGCNMVELGIPFSDPLADGATIQRASYHALRQGVTVALCLDVAQELRRRVSLPLVFMSYYNPILSFGLERFCATCREVGIEGLIVPDLPPEEGEEADAITLEHGLDLVYLVAPTSTDARIELIAKRSRGFVYLVSVAGVTGARDALPPELEAFVARARRATDKPLCVGFGVSTPEQAGRVAQVADGVIVGSRLIQLLEGKDPIPSLRQFAESMRTAMDGVAKRPPSQAR